MSLPAHNYTCGMFRLIMFTVEMYMIIIITLMTAAQGLHQTCNNYCKHLPNQLKNTRPECNCTDVSQHITHHFPTTTTTFTPDSEISEIDYEPQKINSILSPKHEEKPSHISKTKTKEHDMTNTTETERIAIADDNTSLQKYKRNYENASNNIIEFPLYLDIDLHTQPSGDSSNLKGDLKNIFDSIRASEKDISECINLHIYIFSKNIDNINTTHTNWGHHVKHDNLSNSEVLTEIQKKCDQPTTIIHESIYEIRQRNHGLDLPENNHTSAENSSNYNDENQTISQDIPKPLTYSDLYHVTSEIVNNDLLQIPTSMNVVEKAKVNRNAIESHTLYASTHQLVPNKEGHLNTTEPKTKLMSLIDSRKSMGISRKGYSEQDVLIPKIITKEFANNTVISIVDGYERMPNLDFVDDTSEPNENAISSDEDNAIVSTQSDLSNINYMGNRNQSGIVQDIKGDLFFLFGNNQVPARFIQNAEGEMHLAVDGFRLCDQVIQHPENKLVFMNLLCNCIKFHYCSPPSVS